MTGVVQKTARARRPSSRSSVTDKAKLDNAAAIAAVAAYVVANASQTNVTSNAIVAGITQALQSDQLHQQRGRGRVGNTQVNSFSPTLGNALQQCASPGFFYTANIPADITNALNAMFNQAMIYALRRTPPSRRASAAASRRTPSPGRASVR